MSDRDEKHQQTEAREQSDENFYSKFWVSIFRIKYKNQLERTEISMSI